MSIEVWWAPGFPDEVREAAEPLVNECLKYLPRWVCHMSIRYNVGEDDKGAVASIATEHPYRQVKLYITPRFLEDNKKNRRRTFIHEFYHAPMGPIREWVRSTLENFIGDDDMKKHLFEAYTDLEEGVVQDWMFVHSPPGK